MRSVRLHITGRVQGVGFRYAMREEALRRGVRGWVRNRSDGAVEALLQGEAAHVEALIEWARRGPAGARVTHVRAEAAESEAPAGGFEQRSTV